MKLPWKREPEDLVGSAVDEVAARDEATRNLITPFTAQAGTSWAEPWREYLNEQDWAQAANGGIMFLPEEVTFPGDSTLRADGGWCAPSEVMYAMERALAPAGKGGNAVPLMIEIPEVQMRRGGMPQPPARRRPRPPRPDRPYPNPAFLAASVANPGLLPLAFMRDPTAP